MKLTGYRENNFGIDIDTLAGIGLGKRAPGIPILQKAFFPTQDINE